MSRHIFKYTLRPSMSETVTTEVRMPAGATILSVGAQGDDMRLWAAVVAAFDTPEEVRSFYVVPTGGPEPDGTFVGTVLMYGGTLVFHVFEAGDDA